MVFLYVMCDSPIKQAPGFAASILRHQGCDLPRLGRDANGGSIFVSHNHRLHLRRWEMMLEAAASGDGDDFFWNCCWLCEIRRMKMMDKWGTSNIYGISRLGNSEIHPPKGLVCSKQFDFTAKPKPHRDTGIVPTRPKWKPPLRMTKLAHDFWGFTNTGWP